MVGLEAKVELVVCLDKVVCLQVVVEAPTLVVEGMEVEVAVVLEAATQWQEVEVEVQEAL